jgi:hypothetical protein
MSGPSREAIAKRKKDDADFIVYGVFRMLAAIRRVQLDEAPRLDRTRRSVEHDLALYGRFRDELA